MLLDPHSVFDLLNKLSFPSLSSKDHLPSFFTYLVREGLVVGTVDLCKILVEALSTSNKIFQSDPRIY